MVDAPEQHGTPARCGCLPLEGGVVAEGQQQEQQDACEGGRVPGVMLWVCLMFQARQEWMPVRLGHGRVRGSAMV